MGRWNHDAYPYLATVRWTPHGPPVLLVQNRAQTEQVLFSLDPQTGELRELLRESDPAWLNLDQDMPRPLPGGKAFLWTTERRGARQLEIQYHDGSPAKELTPVDWIYRGLAYLDPDGKYAIIRGGESPLDTELFHLSLTDARLTPMSQEKGTHAMVSSADGSLHVRTHMPEEGPTTYGVWQGGKRVGRLSSVVEKPLVEGSRELVTVGDDPVFHAVVLRPRDFDPAKTYPVILSVYGGPHVQRVTRYSSQFVLDQWLADQGFIIVVTDGRGTPNRGRAWERAIHHDLIATRCGTRSSCSRAWDDASASSTWTGSGSSVGASVATSQPWPCCGIPISSRPPWPARRFAIGRTTTPITRNATWGIPRTARGL